MLTDEEITWGYRFVLDRMPDPGAIAACRHLRDVRALRAHLMSSQEFRARMSAAREWLPPPPERPRIVFQHIPKCAGTAVHEALVTALGDPALVCPERHNGLRNWAPVELMRYRLFSGHYDAESTDTLPGPTRVFTVLRAPEERLMSLYRYLSALSPEVLARSGRNMHLASLARRLPAEAFFADADVRANPAVNNGMLRALSGWLPGRSWEGHAPRHLARMPALPPVDPALRQACARLEKMTAVLTVEQLENTLPAAFAALGLPPPRLGRANVTGTPSSGGSAAPTHSVPSARLQALLADLTAHDKVLYDIAQARCDPGTVRHCA
jgi:hypothetical protein